MIKQKKCCGTGMAKGYGCGKLVNVENRKYGLGKSCCYAEWLFNSDCGKVILNKAINQVQKPRIELEKAFEEKKDRHKITTLIQAVVTICHTYIKLRDKDKPCIACGTPYNDNFHAGHFYKAELYSSLKFNEFNIHGSCVECNIRKEGNLSQYAVNIATRIGTDAFKNLNYLANQEKKQVFKWDREMLKATRDYYKAKIKQLNG